MMINDFSFPRLEFNKKNIIYSIAAGVLYLFFLVINLPAKIVLSSVNLPTNLVLSSVSGSIWSGGSKNVKYSGIELGSMKWQVHPLNILLGEVSANISIINNKQYVNTEVILSSSGKIELEETRFLINLSTLQPLTYGMPFSYLGKASGYFPVSFFKKNEYVGINGKLSLSSIELISPQHQTFGDFIIDFRAEKEGATSGQIKDNGGSLDLLGQLTLNKDGQFNVSAKLAAREAGSSLEQMLSFLGKKDASGRVSLSSNLKLWR